MFIVNKEEIEPGLIIFQRGDVRHDRWSCRIKLPGEDRYKTIALDTCDKETARERALGHGRTLAACSEYGGAPFNPPFSHVARRYIALQRARAATDLISPARLRKIETVIAKQLLPYVGAMPMDRVPKERWAQYRSWRRGDGARARPVGDVTVAAELGVFNDLLNYAVSKGYLPADLHFNSKPKYLRRHGEGLTQDQLHHLLTTARRWIAAAKPSNRWHRQMAYYLILVITHTGLRTEEARNLCWRDVSAATDGNGTPITVLNVHGRGKSRSVVAWAWVGDDLERIRSLSAAREPEDRVFTTIEGKPAQSLYRPLVRTLLIEAGLRNAPGEVPRSTYALRHTYAMGRLGAGVSIYLLTVQMGTRVSFIEDYYHYAIAVRDAKLILGAMDGQEHDL